MPLPVFDVRVEAGRLLVSRSPRQVTPSVPVASLPSEEEDDDLLAREDD
jgi:hypothetical protein